MPFRCVTVGTESIGSLEMTAARDAGHIGATAMIGVVIMLGVAGLLEGFARQLVNTEVMRFTIGGTMLVLWLSYFYLLRLAPRGV